MPESNDHGSRGLQALLSKLQQESGDGQRLVNDLRNNPICSVTVDHSVPCISVVWKRYATSTQLRFVHEKIICLLAAHHVSSIIGDDTELPTIHLDDQQWIAQDWMPRAQSAGLKAAASKRPLSYFGKMAVERVQSIAPKGLALASFETLEEARRWLSALLRGLQPQ